jgi:hypothetical protein
MFYMYHEQWADPLLYLQMMAFYEGRLRGCRVFDPSGYRAGCCCYHDGCCDDRYKEEA